MCSRPSLSSWHPKGSASQNVIRSRSYSEAPSMIWATVDKERRWAYLPRPSSTPSIEIHLSSKSSSTFKIQYGGQFSHEEILSDRAPMLVINDVSTFSRRMALVIGWIGNHAREFRISSLKLSKLIQKRKENESLSSRFLFPCLRPCLPCLPNCPCVI